MVKHINSEEEWTTEMAASSKLVVVDFFAQWCGPCKKISPYIEELSKEFSNASFLKVDVDALPDVAAAESVSAMPTFRFYKNGQRVDELIGANQQRLKELVQKHA